MSMSSVATFNKCMYIHRTIRVTCRASARVRLQLIHVRLLLNFKDTRSMICELDVTIKLRDRCHPSHPLRNWFGDS